MNPRSGVSPQLADASRLYHQRGFCDPLISAKRRRWILPVSFMICLLNHILSRPSHAFPKFKPFWEEITNVFVGTQSACRA